MTKHKEKWEKEFEKLIIKQLFLAWEAGKKQVKMPYKYTLDTDKLGRPIFDMAISRFDQKLEEQREEIIKEIEKEIQGQKVPASYEIVHYKMGLEKAIVILLKLK